MPVDATIDPDGSAALQRSGAGHVRLLHHGPADLSGPAGAHELPRVSGRAAPPREDSRPGHQRGPQLGPAAVQEGHRRRRGAAPPRHARRVRGRSTLRVINTVKLILLSVFLGSSAADYLSRRTPKGAYSFGFALFARSVK